jgi:hypothetical protein
MTMGGPDEEPLSIAVLANTYWTKGQPNIIADNAGIAMLNEIFSRHLARPVAYAQKNLGLPGRSS